MTSRKHSFVEGQFYHIYVHSIEDLVLFKSNTDYKRFLSTLFAANGKKAIPRMDRVRDLNLVWDIREGKVDMGEPLVDVAGFCLMPNHIHLLLGERGDGDISAFMHRILVSYAKYLNLKYERRGHVFESKFHSKLLDDNAYLLRASAYIHLNPKDILGFNKKERAYEWSSFQDYVSKNRWGKLLKRGVVLEQFLNARDYKVFVNSARGDDYDVNPMA